MARIDYYFGTFSPYTYLAGTRLEEIADRHGAEIRYRPLDVFALYARTGGTMPADRHDNRKAYRLQDLVRRAKRAGLPINLQPAHFPPNPAPSSYAIIAAQEAGGGDMGRLVHAILAACWADEKNIADDAVIQAALKGAGFDPGLTNTGLLSGAEAYARNLEDGIEAGVFGAPFYITSDDARFWGQDRLDDLDLHLAGKL